MFDKELEHITDLLEILLTKDIKISIQGLDGYYSNLDTEIGREDLRKLLYKNKNGIIRTTANFTITEGIHELTSIHLASHVNANENTLEFKDMLGTKLIQFNFIDDSVEIIILTTLELIEIVNAIKNKMLLLENDIDLDERYLQYLEHELKLDLSNPLYNLIIELNFNETFRTFEVEVSEAEGADVNVSYKEIVDILTPIIDNLLLESLADVKDVNIVLATEDVADIGFSIIDNNNNVIDGMSDYNIVFLLNKHRKDYNNLLSTKANEIKKSEYNIPFTPKSLSELNIN